MSHGHRGPHPSGLAPVAAVHGGYEVLDYDAVLLSRIQFAFTIGFHIIYPSFSIGLASYLATLNGLSLFTGRSVYLSTCSTTGRRYSPLRSAWGVVSGLVMSYQFGTNWSVFFRQ